MALTAVLQTYQHMLMEICPFKPHMLLKTVHGKGALKLCNFPSDALYSFKSTHKHMKKQINKNYPITKYIYAHQMTDLLVTAVLFVKVTEIANSTDISDCCFT